MMMIMTMILPGTAAVCSISTSKMCLECPSKDIGRSELIAEGEDDNHHFDDDEQKRDNGYAVNDGGEYHTIIFIGPLLVLLATCILTKIAHFHWRSPLIAFFAGVSLNTQIPVSTEKKKNCANIRQFKNATISCD